MRIGTDHRTDAQRADTVWFAIATDSCMSGWGRAPGRSLFAVPCRTRADAEVAADNLRARSEMKRVRIVFTGTRIRMWAGDHMSVSAMADHWFTPGYFAAQAVKRRAECLR
jgi:hypothetical protein